MTARQQPTNVQTSPVIDPNTVNQSAEDHHAREIAALVVDHMQSRTPSASVTVNGTEGKISMFSQLSQGLYVMILIAGACIGGWVTVNGKTDANTVAISSLITTQQAMRVDVTTALTRQSQDEERLKLAEYQITQTAEDKRATNESISKLAQTTSSINEHLARLESSLQQLAEQGKSSSRTAK